MKPISRGFYDNISLNVEFLYKFIKLKAAHRETGFKQVSLLKSCGITCAHQCSSAINLSPVIRNSDFNEFYPAEKKMR